MANFLSSPYVLLRFVVERNAVRSLQQGEKGKWREMQPRVSDRGEIRWTQRCREKKASEREMRVGGRESGREGGREGAPAGRSGSRQRKEEKSFPVVFIS